MKFQCIDDLQPFTPVSKYFIKMVILIARKIYRPPFIHAFKVDIEVKKSPHCFHCIDRIELFRDYIMSYK